MRYDVIHRASVADASIESYGAGVRCDHAGGRSFPAPPLLALVAITFVQVAGSFGASDNQPDARSLDVLGVALLIAGPAALALLRRQPLARLWIVLAITVAYLARGYAVGPVAISPTAAVVIAVMGGRRRAAWIATGVGAVAMTAAHWVGGRSASWRALAGVVVWIAVATAGAELLRTRRDRRIVAALAAAEERKRRASEERVRIAQELHDVLAHDISLINVQAGVGLHLMDRDPERARDALVSIKAASKDALGELGAVLDLLRGDSDAPRVPMGGLDQIEQLVDRVRAPQLAIVVERVGVAGPVPPGPDLAAYRIVQEALTNVVRHAPTATRVRVRLERESDQLIVQVDDDGHAGASTALPGGGNGLPGMRERALALGGSFTAGARPGGGFRVRASLPLGLRTST